MLSCNVGINSDHMYPSYWIIKKQQPCYSTPFYLLFSMCSLANLLLNPSGASKIGTHVPTWICSQACLKILMKIIINLFDNCWSLSYNKFFFNMDFNKFDDCSICSSPWIYYSFNSFILSFLSFSFFDFLCNCLLHGIFPLNIKIFNTSHNMWLKLVN